MGEKKNKTGLILTLFLLGIFMGAMDNGIVSPAREIIQNSFGVKANIGVWMITIYTLSYAISMPVVSKMADRYGYKKIYVMGIATFGLGSLLCGLTDFYGNFGLFLSARVIQAIGAGGIIPIATTVIGQSFPKEKRGMALGMVGGIFGIATIIGPTLGSFILDIVGVDNWGWLFFINVPISIIILILSIMMNTDKKVVKTKLDILGVFVVGGGIASLMYALTNLDFFHFTDSIVKTSVYPYLILFLVFIPLTIYVESRAEDPILNLNYFKNKQLLITFTLALVVGVGMMGMVFVPQFAENVLKLKAGSGGYLVTLLAVFSGVAAPISGKLLDKKGAKFVLTIGFGCTLIGTLLLGFWATQSLTFISVLGGLAFMGLGVGFTMGAPLNYLVLNQVDESQGATALATMSLIRSMGVAVSPSIMIGFIVEAGKQLQGDLMTVLQTGLSKVMPQGMSMGSAIGGNSKATEAFASLQSADVTTIVGKLKEAFGSFLPPQVSGTVENAIDGMKNEIVNTFQSTVNTGYMHMFIAAAIIAFVGILFTLLLKNNPKIEVK